MEQKYGPEKTRALAKYFTTAVMTAPIATEIVNTLWGDAPAVEKTKCILICQNYQLNPLMKHLYLIGYKRKDSNGKQLTDTHGVLLFNWSIQIGIGATRLMAQRKHNYSYLDLSPRKATQEEIDRILGDTADPTYIYGFTHIKDMDTGAEAFGLRGIGKNENIKGRDKGNTHLNQACIRSERLALDRQYPGEMPQGVEVIDERYVDADYRVTEAKADQPPGGGDGPTLKGAGESGELGEEEGRGEDATGATGSTTTKNNLRKNRASADRDPTTIKDLGQLFQALLDDFGLSKEESLRELNATAKEDLTELPRESYIRVKAARQKL